MRFRYVCVILFILICGASHIKACMCGATSVCEAYSQANAVVVAEVTKYVPAKIPKNIIFKDAKPNEYEDGQNVTIKIDKWFKGKGAKTLILSQFNSTCDWIFDGNNLNKKYLFYLSHDKKSGSYSIVTCGRNGELDDVADDLAWLSDLPKSLNRTRISGVAKLKNSDFSVFPNVKLKITGNKKTYQKITDKNGLYEIWDVPSGEYFIEPQIPNDFILSWTTSVPNNWHYFWSSDEQDRNALKVDVVAKGCGGIDFMFEGKK